jgi:TonB family protein
MTVKTDAAGNYAAKDLPAGKYDVAAAAAGFKTRIVKGVEVTEGKGVQVNLKLEVANWGGCCEYAAPPMRLPDDSVPDTKPLNAYSFKMKPFTYSVGEADDQGTLKGVAKLVYGDQKLWVQIYEANANVVVDPNAVPAGTSLTIPALFQQEPRPVTKKLPSYPPEALSKHIHGEVAMDVTLNDDGAVLSVRVIEGDPLLIEAATEAVKQWKYKPLRVDGELVNRVLVVITFEKNGKVR